MDQALAPFKAEALRLFHLLTAILRGLPHSVSGFRWMLSNLECNLKRWFVFEAHARALAIFKEEETRGRNYTLTGKRDLSQSGTRVSRKDRSKRRLPFVVMQSFVRRERKDTSRESGWTRRSGWTWRERALYSFTMRVRTLLQVLKDPDHTLARTTRQWLDQMRAEHLRAQKPQAHSDARNLAVSPTHIRIPLAPPSDHPSGENTPPDAGCLTHIPEPET